MLLAASAGLLACMALKDASIFKTLFKILKA
jgi:hypothetical protein